jgi:hypothetical protein
MKGRIFRVGLIAAPGFEPGTKVFLRRDTICVGRSGMMPHIYHRYSLL